MRSFRKFHASQLEPFAVAASVFSAVVFSVGFACLVVAFLPGWTAILTGGTAVVCSDFVCFAEDGVWLITFCPLATGRLGQTALGAKKSLLRLRGSSGEI